MVTAALPPAAHSSPPAPAVTRSRPSLIRRADYALSGMVIFVQVFSAVVGTLVLAASSLRSTTACHACHQFSWLWAVVAIALSAVGGALLARLVGGWIRARTRTDRSTLGLALVGALVQAALLTLSFGLASVPLG